MPQPRLLLRLVLLAVLVYGVYLGYYFSDYRIQRESRVLWQLKMSHGSRVMSVRTSPEGQTFLLNDTGLRVYDSERRQVWQRELHMSDKGFRNITSYELGPDGQLYCLEIGPAQAPVGPMQTPGYLGSVAQGHTMHGHPIRLLCLDQAGQERWSLETPLFQTQSLVGSLVLASPGYVLVADEYGNVLTSDSHGNEIGRFSIQLGNQPLPQTNNNQQICLDELGQVYLMSIGTGVTAYDPAGQQLWQFSDPSQSYGELTQAPDGTLYYANGVETIALSRKDGSVRWRAPVPGGTWNSAPSFYVAPGLGLWVLGTGSDVFLLGLDGQTLWQGSAPLSTSPRQGSLNIFAHYYGYQGSYSMGYDTLYGAAVGPDGELFLATAAGGLEAISATGRRLWRARLPEEMVSSPYLGADGGLYTLRGWQLSRIRR